MERFVVPASARSWIEVSPDSHFPIQNIPFSCALSEADEAEGASLAPVSVIGDWVIDLWELASAGLLELPGDDAYPWQEGPEALAFLREELFKLLDADNPALRDNKKLQNRALVPLADVSLWMPMPVNCFVDFYSGINHASNVGRMFRPDQPPLLPNYRHLPVGYNGRASSVVASECPIHRPLGIQKVGEEIVYGPSKELDFELEMGFFVGGENPMGHAIPIEDAEEFMLGVVLVNDWSARDIQRFEYQPLGPFLAKSFATSISPWMVSLDALEPFRRDGMKQDPEPLPHLRNPRSSHYDIQLEVSLQTAQATKPQVICRSNALNLYWSFVQQLTHQASNGTPLEVGDLYASGTISGEDPGSFGSLLELTWRGQNALTIEETGETRTFLEDGDVLTLTGFAQGDGFRVGFGEVSGRIEAAIL